MNMELLCMILRIPIIFPLSQKHTGADHINDLADSNKLAFLTTHDVNVIKNTSLNNRMWYD